MGFRRLVGIADTRVGFPDESASDEIDSITGLKSSRTELAQIGVMATAAGWQTILS